MNRSNARKFALAGGVLAALPILVAVAIGVTYDADVTNFGYIAGPAMNQQSISNGSAVAYVPWFDTDGYYGDLLASPIATSGDVDLETTSWRAEAVMSDAETAAPDTYWDTGRFIVTMNLSGSPVAFRDDSIDEDQLDMLADSKGKKGKETLNYLRGDRSKEGGKDIPRVRTSLLGPFIHSNPVYVGRPDAGYAFDGYLGYVASNYSRAGRVYIGGNDGMLHAFDAATGEETFAYVPSILFSKLRDLIADPYEFRYYVDGPLTAADVYYNSAWHMVLVGTLGHGGKGVFALDVTSAAAITSEDDTASGAASRLLWELDEDDFDGANLGNVHGKVAVGRMQNGDWVAVVGNGYDSASGWATLIFIDIETGNVIREISVSDKTNNGMSAPTLVDIDHDNYVDYAYAGDVNGNLWKFDLSSSSPGSWDVDHGGVPMFETEGGLSITVAPEVGVHPTSGYMVYVATGRLLSNADADDSTNNIVYGLWDHDWSSGEVPLDENDLLTQTLSATTHAETDEDVRVASDETIDWSVNVGWRVSLDVDGDSTDGWRVLTPLTLRSGRLQFMTSSPIDEVGKNWYMQLNALDGGAPDETIVDINRDGALDVDDNVDGDGDDEILDVPEDRIVGVEKRVGLASAPLFGKLDNYSDAVLFNHLAQINQIYTGTSGGDGEDAGILGGHFDLDVSSQTYGFSAGDTDKHTHEWDDKNDSTVVDYFDIVGGGYRHVDDTSGEPGSARTTPFLITIANAHLSTAGVIEINGVGTPVVEYRARIKRLLSNSLGSGERPPLYTLDEPTDAQYDMGVRQLTSLKIRFPTTAILAGGLIGTNTGCVRKNDMGINGEYRNGALTMQLLDASLNTAENYAYDATSETYYKPSGGSHRIHRLGYAVPYDLGSHGIGDGMMYESTIFWHWDPKACYSPEDADDYATEYADEVGTEWLEPTDDDIDEGTGSPDDDEDIDDEGDGDDEPQEFSDVSTTVISASDKLGRLFWREIVPED